jgi:hypothetical protein
VPAVLWAAESRGRVGGPDRQGREGREGYGERKSESFFYAVANVGNFFSTLVKLKMSIFEVTILLPYKNSKVEANFIFFFKLS